MVSMLGKKWGEKIDRGFGRDQLAVFDFSKHGFDFDAGQLGNGSCQLDAGVAGAEFVDGLSNLCPQLLGSAQATSCRLSRISSRLSSMSGCGRSLIENPETIAM